MSPDAQQVATCVLVVVALLLAIAIPVSAHRLLNRPETLREMWLYSRRGSVVTGCVIGILLLALGALLMALLAVGYPFLLSVTAMMFGAIIAVAMVLVRYLRFDARQLLQREGIEPDDEK